MKKLYLLLFTFLLFSSKGFSQADTIQTFTFNDTLKRSGTFLFPVAGKEYRKVLMLYTLKCYPKVSAYDNKYPCGEWDYLTYTFVTGKQGEVFEIARYITPYGINLSLGPNGFTWIYDVTDYMSLLRDSVNLSAGNTQELLDLKFVFVEGTAPAPVIKINQVWDNGATSYSYASLSDNTRLFPKSIKVETGAEALKFRSRITGHGHNSNTGNFPHCCEWKDNTHYLYAAGQLAKEWKVWQTLDCADNPVFPQGGTWPYAREGWCPGDRVKDTEFDLTRFRNGDSLELEYAITPVPGDNLGMGGGNYVMAMHVIQYGKPAFANDAEIYDILSPSVAQMNSRFSPSCSEPEIVIRNNSIDTMTSLDLEYNISGGYVMKYKWTGKLGFLQTETIHLPILDAGFYRGDGQNIFSCTVKKRNGKKDSYEDNNSQSSSFKMPDIYKDVIMVELKTNNFPQETSYEIRDSKNSIVLKKENLAANTFYRDTLSALPAGCYTMELFDQGMDGLNFWANPAQGSGILRFRKAAGGGIMKNFGADFGYRIFYTFIIDSLQVGDRPEYPAELADGEVILYPNPNNGDFTLVTAGLSGDYELVVSDALGKVVYRKNVNPGTNPDIVVEGLKMAPGLYYAKLTQGDKKIVRKMMVY